VDFKDSLRAVRRSARLIVAIFGSTLLVGVLYALLAPATYSSSTQLLLQPADPEATAQETVQVTALIQEQLDTYADLVTTPVVLQPVIDELGLDATPADLAEDVSVSGNTTSILTVEVVSGSATQAADIAGAIGQSMTSLLASTGAGASGPAVQATTVQPAVVPDQKASPRLLVSLVIALAAGFAVAFLVVVLRELLNPYVRNASDVRKATDAPVLARVPRIRRLGERTSPLVALRDGAPAEAFGLLRSKVAALAPASPAVIVVSSPEQAEGKSVVAANLALSFDAVGQRVVLVDANLRAPALARYFNADTTDGLADVLTGRTAPEHLATAQVGRALTLVPTAPAPATTKPSDLLAQPVALDLVRRAAQGADVVIVDAGPLVEPPDAAALGPVASAYLLVARAGRTTHAQLGTAVGTVRTIGGAVVGVVLADTPTTGADADD
jgi:polysaccharide biosynthesis transport protein